MSPSPSPPCSSPPFYKARQTALEQQARAEQEAAAQAKIPLVNVMAPTDFVPLISIVITDSQGHTLRVVVDEQGRQHPEPVLNLN